MRSVVAISLAAILLLVLTGCERYELDKRMDELCKLDGGVKVYEAVKLPATEFDSSGRLAVQRLGYATSDGWTFDRIANDQYRIFRKEQVLKGGDPMKGEGRLVKQIEEVRRMSDQTVLGRSVRYVRTGGDVIVIDHFSGASCPAPVPQLLLSVFTKEE